MKARHGRTCTVFHHILLATDFSGASERAHELAASLGRALRARLTVLHVYESADATSPAMAVARERSWPGAIRARAEIDRTVDRLRAGGLKVDGALRFGILPERIVEAALEIGADLIVTGTRGRKGLARVWYGSVAEAVLRHSPIPVLAAVPRERDDVSCEHENVVQLWPR
jgi:nucleotide-binding universal stress UspA family protein